MARLVEFVKADKVNGQSYQKGDTLSVSSSIADRLINVDKTAKVHVPEKKKKKKKSESEEK